MLHISINIYGVILLPHPGSKRMVTMNTDLTKKKYHSLRRYLMLFIISVIIIVSLTSLILTYIVGGEAAGELYNTFSDYSAQNAEAAIILVSRSLDLLDAEYNPAMKRVLNDLFWEYQKNHGNLSQIHLTGILQRYDKNFNGTIMLKILNPDGIIIYSTIPEDIGIDFRRWPEIYHAMEEIRTGDEFVPDRTTVSVNGTSDTEFSGQLSKYVYLPSPDNRYLFAMGLISESFEEHDSVLSYQRVLSEFVDLNPDLLAIRLYHRYKSDPIAETGSFLAGLPPALRSDYLQKTFATGQEQQVDEPDGDCSRFVYIPIHRNGEIFDNSLVMEHVVSKIGLTTMLNNIIRICLLIMLIAVLVGAVLAYFTSHWVSRSFNKVISDVTTIADGDLDHAITGASIAEFAQLETSINTMVRKIRHYSTELERKEAELAIAATIQKTFLPKECPDIKDLDIMMHTTPAREVGGDFYDFITLDTDRYGIVIADVSGKGVPAALFMALSRTIIRDNACWYTDPAALIHRVNNLIVGNADGDMFVTVFYGIIDMKTMTLTYCNAGHNPPVLFHANKNMDYLSGTGMAIGVFSDMPYEIRTIAITPGDTLLCYTDGVTEAIDSRKNQFGEERLIPVIHENKDLSAREIINTILDKVRAFCGGEPQFDDITIIVLRVL